MTEQTHDGRLYLILGGSGGIGSELAARLRCGSARVVIAARDRERLDEVATSLDCEAVVLDAREPQQVVDCAKQVAKGSGRLDGIVNCVGSVFLKPAHRTTAAEWDEVMATNLRSAFGAVRAGAETMRRTGGSLVLVSSVAAGVGLANHEAIGAAKAGVEGLTRAAAASYAPRLRVNAVAPGLVETRLTEALTSGDATREASEAMHPLGRIGRPGDVASLIEWLLRPEQDWVTGQVFGVDGGLSTVRTRGR